MAKVFDTLAPDGVQHYEAFHHAGFVVATLPFLHPDLLPYASRQSQRPERLHHQRNTSPCREHFRQWFGIDFKQQWRFCRGWLGGFPRLFHSQMLLALFTSEVRKTCLSELLPWVHGRPI